MNKFKNKMEKKLPKFLKKSGSFDCPPVLVKLYKKLLVNEHFDMSYESCDGVGRDILTPNIPSKIKNNTELWDEVKSNKELIWKWFLSVPGGVGDNSEATSNSEDYKIRHEEYVDDPKIWIVTELMLMHQIFIM